MGATPRAGADADCGDCPDDGGGDGGCGDDEPSPATFGGGAKALVGIGAALLRDRRAGRVPVSTLGSVGSSESSLKRAAAYSMRSRDWP